MTAQTNNNFIHKSLSEVSTITEFESLVKSLEIKTSFWGSRKFIYNGEKGPVEVKMSEIVAKFEKLAAQDKNKELIRSTQHKIVELDLKGDVQLNRKYGVIGMLFRDFKNIGSSSHTSRLDQAVENKFNKDIKFFASKMAFNFNNDNFVDPLINAIANKSNLYIDKNGDDDAIYPANKEGRTEFNTDDIKDAIHVLIKDNPNDAEKLLSLLNKKINEKSKQDPQFTKDIASFKEFLGSMPALVIARQPDRREAYIQNSSQIPDVIKLFNKTEKTVDFCKEFINLKIDHKEVLKIFAEKDPESAYPILKALAGNTNENKELGNLCEGLGDKIAGKVSDNVKTMVYRQEVRQMEQPSQDYTATTSVSTQQNDHITAKGNFIHTMNNFGVDPEFVSAPKIKATDPSDITIDTNGLKSSVFSFNITRGVTEDIQADGKLSHKKTILRQIASQPNLGESTSRDTVPPGNAEVQYKKDNTQAALALRPMPAWQQEAMNVACNSKFNSLAPVTTEAAKTASINGFYTPTADNYDEWIKIWENESDRIEYAYIKNTPTGGSKQVGLFCSWAPDFGYSSAESLRLFQRTDRDVVKQEKIQYLSALNTYRSLFKQALEEAKVNTEGVIVKSTGVGLGVFQNNPDIVAKAYYKAALEYQDELEKNNVQVEFQVFEKSNTTTDMHKEDGAHKMCVALGWMDDEYFKSKK